MTQFERKNLIVDSLLVSMLAGTLAGGAAAFAIHESYTSRYFPVLCFAVSTLTTYSFSIVTHALSRGMEQDERRRREETTTRDD